MTQRYWPLLLALLLTACAGSGGAWTKAGADNAAADREHQDCRAMAGTAVETEAGINQDILATRGNDWSRAGVGRVERQVLRDQTRDRAAGIVAACMRAKGFAEAP